MWFSMSLVGSGNMMWFNTLIYIQKKGGNQIMLDRAPTFSVPDVKCSRQPNVKKITLYLSICV